MCTNNETRTEGTVSTRQAGLAGTTSVATGSSRAGVLGSARVALKDARATAAAWCRSTASTANTRAGTTSTGQGCARATGSTGTTTQDAVRCVNRSVPHQVVGRCDRERNVTRDGDDRGAGHINIIEAENSNAVLHFTGSGRATTHRGDGNTVAGINGQGTTDDN